MLFEFKGGGAEAFGVGDWVRKSDDESTERFKMLDVEGVDTDGNGGNRLVSGRVRRL